MNGTSPSWLSDEEAALIPTVRLLSLNDNYVVSLVQQHAEQIAAFSASYEPMKVDLSEDLTFGMTLLIFDNEDNKFYDCFDIRDEIFISRSYGESSWNKEPSESHDFMPEYDESIIGNDFVEYEFDEELFPIKISIYELPNPGSVVKIWAIDRLSRWHKLWSGKPEKCNKEFRIFCPPLPVCRFKTKRVRLEINHSKLHYHAVIRGVSLVGTKELIVPKAKRQNPTWYRLLAKKSPTKVCHDDENRGLMPPRNFRVAFEECFQGDLRKLKDALHKNYVTGKSQVIEDETMESGEKDEFTVAHSTAVSPNFTDDTCGNFAVLEIETIYNIFKYLDLKSLCRCSQLNKRFSDIAREPSLYRNLNLKPYWSRVNASVVKILSTRCKYLQRLDLSWCFTFPTKTLPTTSTEAIYKLLNVCETTLTHLRLNRCGLIDDAVVERISSMRNLQELHLDNCRLISASGFQCLEKLESLRRLSLYFTNIETAALCSIIKKNPELRHLDVSESCKNLEMDFVAIVVANHCPNIEIIKCWRSPNLGVDGIRALSQCAKLRECDFGWCQKIYESTKWPCDVLINLFTSCALLEKIDLTGQTDINDRDLVPLLSSKRIQQIHLAGYSNTTPDLFATFLSRCPQLRLIDLSLHMGIDNRHIRMWRRLYPHVCIKWCPLEISDAPP